MGKNRKKKRNLMAKSMGNLCLKEFVKPKRSQVGKQSLPLIKQLFQMNA